MVVLRALKFLMMNFKCSSYLWTRSYVHGSIHTYVHTYILMYIHTYVQSAQVNEWAFNSGSGYCDSCGPIRAFLALLWLILIPWIENKSIALSTSSVKSFTILESKEGVVSCSPKFETLVLMWMIWYERGSLISRAVFAFFAAPQCSFSLHQRNKSLHVVSLYFLYDTILRCFGMSFDKNIKVKQNEICSRELCVQKFLRND